MARTRHTWVIVAALLGAASACDDGPVTIVEGGGTDLCDLPQSLLATGAIPEAIPALTEPLFVPAARADHMEDADRILGVVVKGEARAYPHNILWSHEIVNDRFGDQWVSVSFCPLTGSGLAMDATINGQRVEFAVSGLLFANNLVMFDRISEDLYGPQLAVTGRCQRFTDLTPQLIPVREMSWGRWRELYPNTSVMSDETGFNRNYRWYPYGAYDEVRNSDLLFPFEVDRTRPIKERVLSIRNSSGGGRGYPFGELASLGDQAALNETVGSSRVAIFYEGRDRESAMAYRPFVGGQLLTFEATDDGFRDVETGSLWTLAGHAVEGPLTASVLEPLADAYVVFWFAWRQFQPDGEVWIAQ